MAHIAGGILTQLLSWLDAEDRSQWEKGGMEANISCHHDHSRSVLSQCLPYSVLSIG